MLFRGRHGETVTEEEKSVRKTARHVLFHGGVLSNWAMTPFDGRTAYAHMRRLLDEAGVAGQPDDVEISGRLRGRRYANVEQWMMAAKAWLMGDLDTLKSILDTPDPRAVKALGRKVKPFDPKLWEAACEPVVTAGCIAKFTSSPRLEREILDTGDLVLVEASKFDRIWGIGIDWRDADADDPSKWKGLNRLGRCLMAARRFIATRQER